MSSDFVVFTCTDGQAVAVRASKVNCVKNTKDEYTLIYFSETDFVKVNDDFCSVMQKLQQPTIAPPAQLIPCDPMPLGVTIEQLGAVIGELTPMLEAMVQAKQA
jgi:hypothetical protein